MSTKLEIIDGRPQLNIGGTIVKQYSAHEIFTRSNLKPFVFITETGGGKTYTACDIIRACAESGFNQINYVTSTFNSDENKYARDQILGACVVQNNYIQTLLNIIDEAAQSQQENFVDQLKVTAEKIMSQLEKDDVQRFKESVLTKMRNTSYTLDFLVKRICCGESKSSGYLTYIFKQSQDPLQFKQNLEQNKNEIMQLLGANMSDLVQVGDVQKTKRFVINDWCQQVEKIFRKYDKDYIQICKQILRGKIKQHLQTYQGALVDFQINGKTGNKDIDNYIKLIVDQRRLCLIVDDITHILAQSGARGAKVLCDGKEMSEKDAFYSVFNRILTQGRHLGTIMLGIHQAQNLDSRLMSMVSNVIINPRTNLANNRNLFVMQGDKKQKITQLLERIGQSNRDDGTFFNLICFNDPDQSPDPNSQYVLYQAESQMSGQFNLGIYKNAPFFYELGKLQMKKQYTSNAEIMIQQVERKIDDKKKNEENEQNENEIDDDDDGEEYYEDEDEDSDSISDD